MDKDVEEKYFNDFAIEKLLKGEPVIPFEVDIEKAKVAMLWRIAQALEEIWKKL